MGLCHYYRHCSCLSPCSSRDGVSAFIGMDSPCQWRKLSIFVFWLVWGDLGAAVKRHFGPIKTQILNFRSSARRESCVLCNVVYVRMIWLRMWNECRWMVIVHGDWRLGSTADLWLRSTPLPAARLSRTAGRGVSVWADSWPGSTSCMQCIEVWAWCMMGLSILRILYQCSCSIRLPVPAPLVKVSGHYW